MTRFSGIIGRVLLIAAGLACSEGDRPPEATATPFPSPAPTANAASTVSSAFRAFASAIEVALQRGDASFFRDAIADGPVGLAVWRADGGGNAPPATVLAEIEQLWQGAVAGASDQYGGAAPRVFALGVMENLGPPGMAGPAQAAVMTAVVGSPEPRRVALLTHWRLVEAEWRLVHVLRAYALGEEFLEPLELTRGWISAWERFQP
jgi:hypothetical protein